MKRKIRFSFSNISWMLLFCCVGLLLPQVSGAADNSLKVGGYVRTWASFNLNDSVETREDDTLEPSMLRGSLKLDFQGRQGIFLFKAVARFDGEYKTEYLRNAESEVHSTNRWVEQLLYEGTTLVSLDPSATLASLAGGGGPIFDGNRYKISGPSNDIMDPYNDAELREAYIEFDPSERVTLRLGKQQVVWGETDFFRAMDVVHGFDYRWRGFMEPENEELRKPLILANMMVMLPEINGSLQLLFRPGWDEKDQIGNRHATGGGRWSPTPYLGLDFLSLLKYNYRYKDGDVRTPTGGARWSGVTGPVEYSLNYLKTYNDDFCLNSRTDPKHEIPDGVVGDFVHPFINIYGATATGFVPFLDVVLSTEVAFTPSKPYTTGTGVMGNTTPSFYVPADDSDANYLAGVPLSALATDPAAQAIWAATGLTVDDVVEVQGDTIVIKNRDLNLVDIPGFGGIKRKDTLMMMFRVDKILRFLQPVLNTYAPPFFTVQLFDQWIMNFDRKDQIIVSSPFGARRKEHSSIITGVLMLEYMNQSIKPQLAGGYDITYDGGFFFPSCEFMLGDHWRLRAEADFFFQNSSKDFSPTDISGSILNLDDPANVVTGGIQKDIESDTHMFGFFKRRDQFLLRLTYQF